MSQEVLTFADAEARLADALPGYESRPQQQALAAAIEQALATGTHLLAEAGTGVGKSLGYLIPSILSGRRVIVSTATRALQDQLCVAPETRILTADLRHIRADEVYVGQHLVGFDEERVGTRRRYRDSVVESVSQIERPCYELEFDDGTVVVASSEHKWLAGHQHEVKWMTTERLVATVGKRPGSQVLRLSDVWDTDTSWEGGYLAGLYDGEGCLQQRKVENQAGGHFNSLTFSQTHNECLKIALSTLDGFGIEYSSIDRKREKEHHKQCSVVRISQRPEIMRVLGQFRPGRLLAKFDPEMLGTIPARRGKKVNGARLIRKTFVGDRKVIAIKTSTRTYIAEGLASHNCNKDIPFLQANLGVEFTAALLKGRSNYICINKTQEADPGDVPSLGRILGVLSDRADDPTFTGERDELGFEITNTEWMKIAADSDDCQVHDCKSNANCYAQRAKLRALEADVVIVNHALYMTDLMVRVITYGNADLIGPHDVVVFDEAHEVEEYASKTLGTTLREGAVRGLVTELRNFTRRYANQFSDAVDDAISGVLTAMDALWQVLEPGRVREADLLEHGDQFVDMVNALVDLDTIFGQRSFTQVFGGDEGIKKRRERLTRRLSNMTERFGQIVVAPFDEVVRWVEIEKDRPVLKAAPISVAPYLSAHLFDSHGITAILASATLSVGGKFDYIAGRLGIENYNGIDVGTPFTYEDQAVLYVPTNLPDPGKERAAWSAQAMTEMMDLIKTSEGRALVLFTSIAEMRQAFDVISNRLPYRCMMQGQPGMSNRQLAEEFQADTSSVLFATRSFFTGIDMQGETLSLVIIHKLPFPVPSEPLIEARCEAIKRRGGNDFSEYTIPTMSLTLKQGFGRLIRHRNDRGVVAILDPRLVSKGYGQGILRSLPPAPLVSEFTDVEGFFGKVPA